MLSLAFLTSAYCQNMPDPAATAESEEAIEEIRVYGEKSLVRFRQEVNDAEQVFFDRFNELNSDDDLDIHCYREATTGSHIKRRVCKANYLRRLEAEATRQMLLSMQAGAGGSYLDPVLKIREMDKLLHEELARLAVEHPEVLEALQEFVDMKKAYESERKKRCEGRIILCR